MFFCVYLSFSLNTSVAKLENPAAAPPPMAKALRMTRADEDKPTHSYVEVFEGYTPSGFKVVHAVY
jgi:hypothetical protein